MMARPHAVTYDGSATCRVQLPMMALPHAGHHGDSDPSMGKAQASSMMDTSVARIERELDERMSGEIKASTKARA